MIVLMLQGNDIGEDRVMTFSDVRDEVCRLVLFRLPHPVFRDTMLSLTSARAW